MTIKELTVGDFVQPVDNREGQFAVVKRDVESKKLYYALTNFIPSDDEEIYTVTDWDEPHIK